MYTVRKIQNLELLDSGTYENGKRWVMYGKGYEWGVFDVNNNLARRGNAYEMYDTKRVATERRDYLNQVANVQ